MDDTPSFPRSVREHLDEHAVTGRLRSQDVAIILHQGSPGLVLSMPSNVDQSSHNQKLLDLMVAVVARSQDPTWVNAMVSWLDRQTNKPGRRKATPRRR
jgi:hypothetical protein